jgi:hypothetical protein
MELRIAFFIDENEYIIQRSSRGYLNYEHLKALGGHGDESAPSGFYTRSLLSLSGNCNEKISREIPF